MSGKSKQEFLWGRNKKTQMPRNFNKPKIKGTDHTTETDDHGTDPGVEDAGFPLADIGDTTTNNGNVFEKPFIQGFDHVTEQYIDDSNPPKARPERAEAVTRQFTNIEGEEDHRPAETNSSHERQPVTQVDTPKRQTQPEKAPFAYLLIKSPAHHRGDVIRIDQNQRVRIGTDQSCDIVIDDDMRISRIHADFQIVDDEDDDGVNFIVFDLNSSNGTYINEESDRLNGMRRVQENDEIRMGSYTFVFKLLSG